MILWNEIIANPDKVISVDRKTLWAIWNVITSTPLDQRDKYWEFASKHVKLALNEDRTPYPATITMLPGETTKSLIELLKRLGAKDVKELPENEGSYSKGFVFAVINPEIAAILEDYGVSTTKRLYSSH